MTTEPILVARDLHQSFTLGSRKVHVLQGVSLSVHRGESLFLVGASGAGKTTLLYTLAGLERPQSGSVVFDGHALYDHAESTQARHRNQHIGFVFQGYFLLPELTALENVLLPTMIGRSVSQDRAEQALEHVGLKERLHHLPAELSGGEQQRVAIARALINDPAIIFADEPTGNLDSKTGEGIVELLLNLVHESKKTLVLVTHDPKLATRGNRMLEMRDGLLV
jgi:putative ABC transport system ATP-binding protein/lipoprotein-releasing system ATP-binding protein